LALSVAPMWSQTFSFTLLVALSGALFSAGYAVAWFFLKRRAAASSSATPADQTINTQVLRTEVVSTEAVNTDMAAKSRMIAMASHELRTPLNGILGLTELLQGTNATPEQLAYADAIRTSATALISIVDEMLDFSRIEAGKLALTDEPFEPALLIEEVIELLAPRAQGKGLEIASYVAADVPEIIHGDRGRLRQILLNLAGNAIKFTQTGGVGIRLTRHPARLSFDIADTGRGIAPDLQSRIFGDYERGPDVKEQGSGLGLAISRRLAVEMGGALTLESKTGEGSLFRLTLPLDAVLAVKVDKPRAAKKPYALVVAQSQFEAPFLCLSLTDAGFEAASVKPEQALGMLARAQTLKPDLVIVDCSLGLETTKALATALHAAGIARSLLMFSPFERRAFGQATIRDFDGWLVKPIRQRSLLARLEPETAPPQREAKAILALPRPYPALTVLLAEDDEINALIATRHLERLGAQVMRCRSGAEAIARATTQAFDLIFLDLNMPDRDGFEAARAIRASRNKATPLVAITAERVEPLKEKLAAAGFDEALEKPANFREMSRIIETIISNEAEIRISALKKLSNALL